MPGKGKARQGKGNNNKSTKKLCMEQAFPTPRQQGNGICIKLEAGRDLLYLIKWAKEKKRRKRGERV